MCLKGVKYCKINSEFSHIHMFELLVIINPIRFLVLVAMLCTLYFLNSCPEFHAIYFKPTVLPFLSPALTIIAA